LQVLLTKVADNLERLIGRRGHHAAGSEGFVPTEGHHTREGARITTGLARRAGAEAVRRVVE
jgi:hypothetical protein